MNKLQNSANITYRRSTVEDMTVVFSLVSASVRLLSPVPYSQDVVDTWMHGRDVEDYRSDCADSRIWIAEIEGRAIGFSHGETGEIKRLFVDADFAGFGVGAALMKRALDDALSCGSGEVLIEATLNAVPFYKKWGFHEVGEGVFPGRKGLPPIHVIQLNAKFGGKND